MKNTFPMAAMAALLTFASAAHGVTIGFSGGTAHYLGGGSVVTDDSTYHDGIDYYEEAGFRLDFIGNTSVRPRHPAVDSAIIGDWYLSGNSVLFGHWASGDYGELARIEVTRIGGGTFSLRSFTLTANEDFGGGTASGHEQTHLQNNHGYNMMLPSEDWSLLGTEILLPSSFENITSFSFYVNNTVQSFGLDNLRVEAGVPDSGATCALLALGLCAVAGVQRRWGKHV